MGGIVEGLFGGKKATSQSSSQQSQLGLQSSTPSDFNPFASLRDIFGPTLASMTQAGSSQFNPFAFGPGPVAPMGAGETAALAGLNAAAFNPQRQQLLSQTLGGNFLPGQAGGNPFLQAAISAAQAPTALALENALQRRIPGAFAAAGHTISGGGSSPYQRALGESAFLGGRALSDIATTMSSQAFEAERQRMMQATGLSQSEVQGAQQNFQAQALPRLIQEAGIERGATGAREQFMNWMQLMQLLGGVTAPNLAQSSFGYQYGQGTSQSSGTSSQTPGIFPALFPRGLQFG